MPRLVEIYNFIKFLIIDSVFLILNFRKRNKISEQHFVYIMERNVGQKRVGLCVHHYSKRNLRFSKSLNGEDFELGLEGVINQANISKFIEKSDRDIGKEHLFDFYTYLSEDLGEEIGVFMNDNISLDFNLKEWELLSRYLITDMNIGLIGIGSNTFLTQSLFFPKVHAPHIQTYLFSIHREIWKKYREKMLWYTTLTSLPTLIGKQLVCRVLEQGVTRECLRAGKRIALVRGDNVYIFSSKAWHSKYTSWPLEFGDYRYLVGEKAFSFKGSKSYNIHIYE